jgi:hypothetical protein
MLSPADAHVLRELEAARVPAEVVCRGLARAFEAHAERSRPGDPGPRSVRACLSYIEAEAEMWRAKEVGRNRWDPESERRWVEDHLQSLLARVEKAGRTSSGPALSYHREAWRGVRELLGAQRRAGEGRGAEQVTAALRALESRLLAEVHAQLPPAEVRTLDDRALRRVALRREAASERAYAAAVQAALDAELREALGLTPLSLGEER